MGLCTKRAPSTFTAVMVVSTAPKQETGHGNILGLWTVTSSTVHTLRGLKLPDSLHQRRFHIGRAGRIERPTRPQGRNMLYRKLSKLSSDLGMLVRRRGWVSELLGIVLGINCYPGGGSNIDSRRAEGRSRGAVR
jgi:hypothetical protein